MAQNIFIPQYTSRNEQKRTREVVTNLDWNELWNLNSQQGDHSERYLLALSQYLFGADGFDEDTLSKFTLIDSLIETLQTLKEDKADADQLCATIEYNDSTGIFTFKDRNGNILTTVDLNIEKIPVSVQIVKRGNIWYLVIINTDGTETSCPISDLFNPSIFETDANHAITFDVTVAPDGSQTVKATVKEGTITDAMLNSAVITTLIGYRDAAMAAKTAAESARDTAQLYKEDASDYASAASESAQNASDSADNAYEYSQDASQSASDAAASATSADASATRASEYEPIVAEYATTAQGYATTSANKSVDSEAWATGKRNGVDVTSEDVTYHNNALYYAQQAAEVATRGTVHYDIVQELEDTDKARARANIGTEAYTPSEKAKLSGIEDGAEANVQPDWDESDVSDDSYIHNKPTALSDFTDDLGSRPAHTHSSVISISLPASLWIGSESPFHQTITVTGSTTNSKIDLQPDSTVIAQMLSDKCNALYVENNSNVLTVYAIGKAYPSVDLTVQATITEVSV